MVAPKLADFHRPANDWRLRVLPSLVQQRSGEAAVNKLSVIVTITLLTVVGAAPNAAAQDPDQTQTNRYLGDRWSLRVIGAVSELTSDVSAGQSLGALVNLEKLLGFDEQITTWGIDGFYRFTKNRKHAIRFSYADFSRDAYKAVTASIPIFDVEFIGDVDSSFGASIATFAYQYSFTNTNKTEAGIAAGFGFYDYSLRLTGRYILDNDPQLEEFGSLSEAVLAPVPTVGFYINYALTPKLILDLRTSFIDLSIGDHDGRIFNNNGNLTWYFSRHFGLGFGLSSSDVIYENTGGDNRIKVDLRQTSVTLTASMVF